MPAKAGTPTPRQTVLQGSEEAKPSLAAYLGGHLFSSTLSLPRDFLLMSPISRRSTKWLDFTRSVSRWPLPAGSRLNRYLPTTPRMGSLFPQPVGRQASSLPEPTPLPPTT